MPGPNPLATTGHFSPAGQPSPAPQPLDEAELARDGAVPLFVKSLFLDAEFLLLAGALFGLCAWFVLESGRDSAKVAGKQTPMAFASTNASVVTAPLPDPQFAFAFVSPQAQQRLLPVFDKLAMQQRHEHVPPPATTASVQHALPAEPPFDPLGGLVLTGLPAETRLSAGTQVLDAEGEPAGWALALGDLDNLVIELPASRSGPFQTTLDLHTRAGLKIASLTLEVREEASPMPSGQVSNRKSKVRPAKAVRPPTKTQRKSARPSGTKVIGPPVPVYPGDPPKPVVQQPALAGTVAPSGMGGLFKPDPKDTSSSGLSPASREDPRFMTLRGLGMPPAEGAAPPAAP